MRLVERSLQQKQKMEKKEDDFFTDVAAFSKLKIYKEKIRQREVIDEQKEERLDKKGISRTDKKGMSRTVKKGMDAKK